MFYQKIKLAMEEAVIHKAESSDGFKSVIYFTIKKYSSIVGFEAFIWITGLIYLIFFSTVEQTHFTICPLKNAGIEFCPGCGLGHSITLFFHGHFTESFHAHPLGFIAVVIIIHRIYTLLKTNITINKKAAALRS